MSKKPVCPICSRKSTFWEKKNGFKIYKCDFCGHGFLYPGVKGEHDLLEFYNKEYSETYTPEKKSESFGLRQKQYLLDVAMAKKFTHANISVLDYGCATGQFLNAMPKKWKKFGFEVNQSEIQYILKNYKNIRVFSSLSDVKKHKFDLVTLRGVIEHLFDFKQFFSVLSHSLKKGDKVYICATPDFSSPGAYVYRFEWNQIAPPLHYHQFTAASISMLFAKHGYGLRDIWHPYSQTPYANFQDDAEKFISNTKSVLRREKVKNTIHAYPGTMMSLIFERIK